MSTLSLKETNHAEVKEILKDVKTNKATGYDLIPPRLVKESAEVLCHPLSALINYILNNRKIPQQWKFGEITPVYKKECELSKTNYRSLTILPSLFKVFEKIVELRMNPYFEKIYHKYVFAYRKKLKFEKHIAKICRKVSRQTAVLKRMRNILPFEIRSKICMCFIAPHFKYCSETWHFCNKTTADKLEKANERAIRFVFKDRYTPYEELLAKLGLSSLRHERIKKIICNVYRLLNYSNHLKELLNLKQSKYSRRRKYTLQMPKVNTTTYGLKSWRYQAAKLWKSLPDTARTAENYEMFLNSVTLNDIKTLENL